MGIKVTQGQAYQDAYALIQDACSRQPGSESGQALVIYGPPNSSKTSLALRLSLDALKILSSQEGRGQQERLAVSSRHAQSVALATSTGRHAKEANQVLLDNIAVSAKPRIAQTINALAFGLLSAVRSSQGLTPPKYLDAADQDTLLHHLMEVHKSHAQSGDLCSTCMLLQEFLKETSYQSGVQADGFGDFADSVSPTDANLAYTDSGQTTSDLFSRQLNDDFADALRSLFARMNEVGAHHGVQKTIVNLAGNGSNLRLRYAWEVAFALRQEYAQAVEELNERRGKFNVDSSYLLIQAQRSLMRLQEAGQLDRIQQFLPQVVIVDDAQDLTLAAAAFLGQLQASGASLILLTCPDEAAQTFRGSYPEYLSTILKKEPFFAQEQTLTTPSVGGSQSNRSLDALAAAISLSIISPVQLEESVASRPWKISRYPDCPLPVPDSSFAALWYPTAEDESQAVIDSLMERHLGRDKIPYDNMAIIAHDSADVDTYAAALRQRGVAARVTQVGTPLAQSPAVNGLFSMIRLCQISKKPMEEQLSALSLNRLSRRVQSLATALLDGPYAYAAGSSGRKIRAGSVRTVLTAVSDMVNFASHSRQAGTDSTALSHETHETSERQTSDYRQADLVSNPLDWIQEQVKTLSDLSNQLAPIRAQKQSSLGYTALSETVDPSSSSETSVDSDPSLLLLILLTTGQKEFTALSSFIRNTSSRTAKHSCSDFLDLIDRCRRISLNPRLRVIDIVQSAWTQSGQADRWKNLARQSEEQTARAGANEWLDTLVRLFTEAEATQKSLTSIDDFMDHVSGQDIAADSLARKAPVENAVTVLTPAAAAGEHWDYVWLVHVQDGIWPNLTLRDQLFAADDLTDAMLQGRIFEQDQRYREHVSAVLQNEKKSFLIAVTRARKALSISAVANDKDSPSDFFAVYMPQGIVPAHRSESSQRSEKAGSEADSLSYPVSDCPVSDRGLVARARSLVSAELAQHLASGASGASSAPGTSPVQTAGKTDKRDDHQDQSDSQVSYQNLSARSQDAVDCLALLARDGLDIAQPDHWAFYQDRAKSMQQNQDLPDKSAQSNRTITLSPSAVDAAWDCPICYLLDRKLHGPSDSSLATSYGTLIHAVAQEATEQGLDLLYGQEYAQAADSKQQEILVSLTGKLKEIYGQKKIEIDTSIMTEDVYRAVRNDSQTDLVLQRLAFYFLESQRHDYAQAGGKTGLDFTPPMGTLVKTQAEYEFSSHFTMEDIRYAYNRIDEAAPVSQTTFFHMMDQLAGGFPQEISQDDFYHCVIALKGSIDRLETRRFKQNGQIKEYQRIIDYKTGRSLKASSTFTDLQLACYQLGLIFEDPCEDPKQSGNSEEDSARRAANRTDADRQLLFGQAPQISEASLFTLMTSPLPAARGKEVIGDQGVLDVAASRSTTSLIPELYYQSPLFEQGHITSWQGTSVKGKKTFSLSGGPARPYLTNWDKLFTSNQRNPVSLVRPSSASDQEWERIKREQSISHPDKSFANRSSNGPATTWALSMISRIFFAASLSLTDSVHLGALVPNKDHLAYCRYKDGSAGHQTLCPLCAAEMETVMRRDR